MDNLRLRRLAIRPQGFTLSLLIAIFLLSVVIPESAGTTAAPSGSSTTGQLQERSLKLAKFLFFGKKRRSQEDQNSLEYWTNLCKMQYQQKQYGEALAACDEAIKINKSDPALWLLRSQILLKSGKAPEAVASVDLALKLRRESSEGLWIKCTALSQMHQATAAIEQCDQAIILDRNWQEGSPAIAWFQKGLIYKQERQYTEAIDALNTALRIQGRYSQAMTERCSIQLELGQNQQALSDCTQAIQMNQNWGDSSTATALYYQGIAQNRLGSYSNAVAKCDRSTINPLNTPDVATACTTAVRTQQYQASLDAYNQAIAQNPTDAPAWTKQGVTLATLNRHSEALTSFNWALKLLPNYVPALVNRCAALNKLGQYTEALTACDQALQTNTGWDATASPTMAWNQRGVALAGQGKPEEGLSSLDRGIALNPNDIDTWNNRGVILWSMKQYGDAIAAIDRALQLHPGYAQAWYNKGRVLNSQGNYEAAVKAYDQALQGETTLGDPTIASDIWLNRSVALWQLRRYPEALYSAQYATLRNPRSVAARYNQGIVLTSMNQPKDAAEAYNQAAKLEPSNPNLWLAAGTSLKQAGQYADALIAFDRALRLNANLFNAWYAKGEVLKTLKRYDEALLAFNQASSLNGNDANAIAQQGAVLLKTDRVNEALTLFNAALKVNPSNDMAQEGRSQAQQRLQAAKHQTTSGQSGNSSPSGGSAQPALPDPVVPDIPNILRD